MSDSNVRFLYVEDDEVLARVTQRALAKKGFDVVHYARLEDARKDEKLSSYAYVLLDLKLEDGISMPLISDLKDANPEIKILVLTGYASIANAVQAVKLGAMNYLAKPATVEQILLAFDDANAEADSIDIDETHKMSVRRLEWEHIQQALAANNGNISATARQLNMHRRTLQRKLNKKPVSD